MTKDVLFTKKYGIFAALITVTVSGVGFSVSYPLLSMLFELRGISSFLIGLNTAVGSMGAIFIAPFITPLTKKLGMIKLMNFAIILAGVSLLLFFWVTDFWLSVVIRFGFHAAVTAIIILSEFWINAIAPENKRGFILGVYTTMFSVGFMIGPLLLKITEDISSILPLCYGAIIIFSALIPVSLCRKLAPTFSEEGGGQAFWSFFRLEPLAMITVVMVGISESGIFSIFPVYGLRIGYSPSEFATILMAISLGNIFFQIPIGILMDCTNKNWLFVLFGLFGFAGALYIPFVAKNTFALTVTVFLWGGTIPGLYTLGLARIGSRFTGEKLASANSVYMMNYSIGMILGPVIVGFGMSSLEPHGALWILGIIYGLYSIYTLRRLRFRDEAIAEGEP